MKMRAEKPDGDLDYEENFYILKHTACPAVLTENGFYTNIEDLAILESQEVPDIAIGEALKGEPEYR